jgi:hypothetical protein
MTFVARKVAMVTICSNKSAMNQTIIRFDHRSIATNAILGILKNSASSK